MDRMFQPRYRKQRIKDGGVTLCSQVDRGLASEAAEIGSDAALAERSVD